MNAGPYFVLFLAFADIVFGKLFLVETEDKEPVENGSGEEDTVPFTDSPEQTSYEYGSNDVVPSDALDANLFNRLKNAATPKKGNKSSSKKKTTPKGSGEDVRIKILI